MERKMRIGVCGTFLNITTEDPEEYISLLAKDVEEKMLEAKSGGANMIESAIYAALYFCDKSKSSPAQEQKEPLVQKPVKARVFENEDKNQEALF